MLPTLTQFLPTRTQRALAHSRQHGPPLADSAIRSSQNPTQEQAPPRPGQFAAANTALSAAARLFAIYEMTEQVLQYLEPAQIMRTRRTTLKFREVVKSSHRVRQVAFLEKADNQDGTSWQINYQAYQPTSIDVHDSMPQGYASQRQFLDDKFIPPPGQHVLSVGRIDFVRLPIYRPNPSLLQSDATLMSKDLLCGCPPCVLHLDAYLSFLVLFQGRRVTQRRHDVTFVPNSLLRCRNALDKQSSCLDMFICDPPVSIVTVKYLRYSPRNRPSNKIRFMVRVVSKSSGVRVRDLLEPMRREHAGYFVESLFLHEGYFVSAESQEQVRSWVPGSKCKILKKMEEEKEKVLPG
ncbi:hypothetical protein TI39_contig4202g00023 [Zymoseptoria brevis]|uniref:F-box domain-containing protein n=1 Tax=Zymoseptoria brevis TaxID=1047168 RepID=A0A0F4GDQ1_9PEZI|nr:hypothetical protein TI39_contig4202g00023 [Zymoseptoria brevis]